MQCRSVESLSTFLTKIMKIYLGVLCAAVLTGIYKCYSFSNTSDNYNSQTVFLQADFMMFIIDLAHIFFAAFVFINFLRLIYRIGFNLTKKHNIVLTNTPGWTVGYFFIPILNLYEPYVAIRELLDKMKESKFIDIKLLNYWWALWIISSIMSIILANYAINRFGKSNDALLNMMYLIYDSFNILLTVVWIKFIQTLSKAYNDKYGSKTASDNSVN